MATKLITSLAVLSYPHLHAPQPGKDGGKDKYSATLIFTPELLQAPEEMAKFRALEQAALEAIESKWAGRSKALLASEGFKKGFRRDAESKGYPAGSVYINCRTEQQPGIVTAFAGPDGKPQRMKPEDIREQMYPGAIVRASVTAFAYDQNGNKGVSFALNNLQKVRDGERIDGRTAAEDEFTADLNAQPADLAAFLV